MEAMTLHNTCLMDIGEIISMYTSRNPLKEKFRNTMAKTLYKLEAEDPDACHALENAYFYKLSQIKAYITELNPYAPKLQAGDEMQYGTLKKIDGKGIRKVYDPNVERACYCFLEFYYGDNLDRMLKNMWSTYIKVNKIKIA